MEEFKSTYPLIHNKVTSPRYVTPLLRRPRLLDWLNAHAEARAVVIAAGAGYGKTTLLWQWEREVDFPCYWYKLDRNDRDWTLHISYLVEAISQHYPGFGRRAHSVLRQMGGPGSSRPGVAAFLLAEMHEKLTSPCTFIIDDWQFVASVTEVRGLWNQILRDAPPTCRFVFASRGKPQLQFARFKTHGGYAELRTDDLRITGPEITELFRDVYRNPLTPDEASELERRTEGWAASLQLVEVSMRERRTPEERRALIDSLATRSDSDLFTFLAEEVLDQQTEETRNFLLSTAILQQITPEVAERLAGVHDGMRRLLQLEHAGLFTERLDETRYRYHGLFREFLERRLTDERSEAEVMGLHIHAASYFETSEQWPEAIFHYLRAGLQRQAARLIARYGEDVVSEGRLGMVDEWLQQLPSKTIHDNARLSLLHGEALWLHGAWDDAIAALERAREFFAKKGDRRMEALALVKESSVFHHWGRPMEAAAAAADGLLIAPPDARSLRLRLEGNLAITSSWLHDPMEAVLATIQRITAEALQMGLEHYAAIGMHNVGQLQLEIGRVELGIRSLARASAFWQQLPANPFGDNHLLAEAYVKVGNPGRALDVARIGEARTRSWPPAHAQALCGLAVAMAAGGDREGALEVLRPIALSTVDLGATTIEARILFLELSIDGPTLTAEAEQVARNIENGSQDPRLEVPREAALAALRHRQRACGVDCGKEAYSRIQTWQSRGAALTAATGLITIAPLLLAHGPARHAAEILVALRVLSDLGVMPSLLPRLRHLTEYAQVLLQYGGAAELATLISADPTGWAEPAVTQGLTSANASDRARLLQAIEEHPQRGTVGLLTELQGADVAAVRMRLVHQRAPRLFIGTFGTLIIHRGSWGGAVLAITKRRTRSLLCLLASSADPISRDVVVDTLWPDADPGGAINNLNQTLFQLRRSIDGSYRDGFSAQYIISSLDAVQLNPDLVRMDWTELLRRATCLETGISAVGSNFVDFVTATVRGEFLADAQYEDWAAFPRRRMHEHLRRRLLPASLDVARPAQQRASLAQALVVLDPFDEAASIGLAMALSETGRHAAGLGVLRDLVQRLQDEFQEEPSEELQGALAHLSRKSSANGPSGNRSTNPLDFRSGAE